MDDEAWYSVTPESVARQQAARCRCAVAVDAFTGAGGNAIALARECGHVIAIDCSESRVRLAKSNAAVYGASSTIDFICGDFFKYA
jgi:trimethylguanosine synthase